MSLAVIWYEYELYLIDKGVWEYSAGESTYTSERGHSKRLEERCGSECCPMASFCEFSDEHLNAIKVGNFLTSWATMSMHWKPLHGGLSFRLEINRKLFGI